MSQFKKNTVFYGIEPFSAGFGALYGPLFLYMLPVSVHRMFMNAFTVTIKLRLAIVYNVLSINHLLIEGLTHFMQIVCFSNEINLWKPSVYYMYYQL